MATFEYQALTAAGRAMQGTLEAASPEQAAAMLAEMHLTVTSVTKAAPRPPARRIGRNELLMFNEQLASIAKAGIPLERGLRALAADVQSGRLRGLLSGLADDLEAGASVEEAFERRRSLLPPLYGKIVQAGVKSGRLGEMITSLNRHIEVAAKTRRIIFEAMAYPAVVLALAAVVLTIAFSVLIPSFRGFFANMGTDLPAVTLLFLAMSEHVLGFWAVVAAVVGACVAASVALSTFPAGRRLKEAFYLRLPVAGHLYRAGMLARLADSMALLVGAGCDMPSCLRLAGGASGSETLSRQCEHLAVDIEQGMNIVEAGQFSRVIPPLFFYSVQLGYQRNELQDNLYGLCEMYEQQARAGQSRLQAALMPVMLILVGGFVAIAILSMFLPLVHLIETIGSH